MAILSVASMPDRTRAIATGESAGLLAKMAACTRALEAWGCAHIAIPCNTSHFFFDDIQATTRVPIIHMPREAVRYAVAGAVAGRGGFDPVKSARLLERPVRRIGIMGRTAPSPRACTPAPAPMRAPRPWCRARRASATSWRSSTRT